LSPWSDFRTRSSVTVFEPALLDKTLEHMKHAGVRCYFVVDEKRPLSSA
jgi:hypothetical protein